MSLQVVLLTRSSRPSGAQMAWRLCRASIPFTAIVEGRGRIIRKKKPADFIRTLIQMGPSFIWEKIKESFQIRAHYWMRKYLRGRFKDPVYLSIEELALDYDFPIHWVDDHNSSQTAALLRQLNPDLGVLTNTRKISGPILAIPKRGFLNLHLSELPKYAGLDSIFWALYHGEREIGVTVHFAAEKIDRGDIVLQKKIPVSRFDDERSLYQKALWLGTALAVKAIRQIEDGTFKTFAQNPELASYFSWPTWTQRRDLNRKRKQDNPSPCCLKGEGKGGVAKPSPSFPPPSPPKNVAHPPCRVAEETRGRNRANGLPAAFQKPKVLHLITRMTRGGAQLNTLATVKGLRGRGYDVVLLTGSSWQPEGEILSQALEEGIEIALIAELVREVDPLKDAAVFLKLWKFLGRHPFDIVHTHMSKAGWLGRVAARLRKVSIIIHTPHGHVFHSYFPKWKERLILNLEKYAARRCHRLIALTNQEKEEHLRLGVGRAEQWLTIPSGVSEKIFKEIPAARKLEIRERFNISLDSRIVGFVGRLESVKGPEYLLEAAPKILETIPNARFVFVGDGQLRSELEQRKNELNLGANVFFLGNQNVAELLSIMDVLVVPSLNEGMGRVIVEAGLLRKPVIAARVGGILELIRDDQTGLLIPPRDSAAIARAVIRVLTEMPLGDRLGNDLYKLAVENYTETQMLESIHRLYLGELRRAGREPFPLESSKAEHSEVFQEPVLTEITPR